MQQRNVQKMDIAYLKHVYDIPTGRRFFQEG